MMGLSDLAAERTVGVDVEGVLHLIELFNLSVTDSLDCADRATSHDGAHDHVFGGLHSTFVSKEVDDGLHWNLHFSSLEVGIKFRRVDDGQARLPDGFKLRHRDTAVNL